MTTTSVSSTGGGGSGGATSTAMSSSTGVNMCMNVDCGDPNCQAAGYSCFAAPPSGWTGYFTLFDGKAKNDPGCGALIPQYTADAYTGNSNLIVPMTGCGCGCSVMTQTCALPEGMVPDGMGGMTEATEGPLVSDAACMMGGFCGLEFGLPLGWNGSCYGMEYTPGGQLTCGMNANSTCSAQTGAPCNVSLSLPAAVAGGTCGNPVVTGQPDPTSWSDYDHACGTTAATITSMGCTGTESCLQTPGTPYLATVCIMQSGDVPCPAGTFTNKHTYYQGSSDGRACESNCSCPNPPTGGDCTATLKIYSDLTQNTCNTLVTTITSGSCVNLNGNPQLASVKATFSTPTGATCDAAGGGVMGTATPTMPTTFCCSD